MRVVVLTAFLFGFLVSPAAAGPLDEGLSKVGSIAGAVVELPSGPIAPAPEPPVVSPEVPKSVGSVVQEVARDLAPAPRAPSSVEPSGRADPGTSAPGAGSLGGAPGADAAADAGAEARAREAPAPDPAPAGAGPSPARTGSGAGSSDSSPGSIRAAMPAPLEEWLARLWPAVSLGPVDGDALTAQVAALAPSLLLAGLAASAQPFLPPNDAPTGGPPTATSTAPTASPDSHFFFSPDSGGMSFIVTLITVLAALVGLVALARLTVGEDFFSLRWLR